MEIHPELGVTVVQEKAELWTCDQCGREFVDAESLRLHTSLHEAKVEDLTEAEIVLRRELLWKEVVKQEEEEGNRQPLVVSGVASSPKPRRIYKPNSKRVGLTKVRLEDCLRCDACSCIYIDEQDYYKHMRNFHQKYNTVIPRARRKTPYEYSCTVTQILHPPKEIKQEPDEEVPVKKTQPPPDAFFKEIIKNRWRNKLSKRLKIPSQVKIEAVEEPLVKIKEEPMDDMDYLLSQVEVKIKTEPTDYEEY